MANASPDLIWSVVRDTSCHILKHRQSGRSGMGKRGAEFTTEANNPTSLNAWKYSGLANAKTADVTPVEGGVVLTTKSKDSKRVGKPSKALNKVTLTKDFKRVAKTIIKNTESNFYRPDLTKAVLAKWSLIHKSQKKIKAAKK